MCASQLGLAPPVRLILGHSMALIASILTIHFTVDLWTSSNSLALLGMIAHSFTENGQLCQSVLALRELEGQHTGENQAQLIMKIITEYGIVSQVGYLMMDNAENNETMIRALSASKYILHFSINNLIK